VERDRRVATIESMTPATSAHATPLDEISQGLLAMLHEADPEVERILAAEADRQATTLELIASENHVSAAVMHVVGSWMTNKYAEGYPGKRYYGGCEFHDQVEDLARERAKKLFGCRFANVQPHCGANANIAAFMALLNPGERVLSLPIKSGGHLSHGLKPNFSGTFYDIVEYGLDPKTELLDYDAIEKIALETKPKLIICGYSAYSRVIDFARFRAIADKVGAFLMADIAHIAGLVATGVHPSPFPHAHVVTTTTHKTLRGPRGGLILSNDEEIATKIDRKVFPGSQGGPLMHVIAGKAVAFGEALQPSFKTYSQQVVANARALAAAMQGHGYRLCTGGTDNHLMLVDLRPRDPNLTGADAEKWLEAAGIIVNKNGIPNDPRPPMVTSGLRLGTPALTTRGLKEAEMKLVAGWLDRVMVGKGDAAVTAAVREEIRDFCGRFPLPH
jgi:glycine hydroxymethyltransferase